MTTTKLDSFAAEILDAMPTDGRTGVTRLSIAIRIDTRRYLALAATGKDGAKRVPADILAIDAELHFLAERGWVHKGARGLWFKGGE